MQQLPLLTDSHILYQNTINFMTQRDDIFSKPVRLISKEAGLSATCLEQGLTALRKADFTEKWNYYQSFFLISIGIERLLKLAIITISRVEHNKLPSNNELKTYGHKIDQLYSRVMTNIHQSDKFLESDEIYSKIISFLTEFASTSRYYNLDSLSGAEKNQDPLHIWKEIQDEILIRHGSQIEISNSEKLLISEIQEFTSTIYTDEKDNLITDFGSFYLAGKQTEIIQSYSVYYLYNIINHIATSLDQVSSKIYMYPVLTEFFPLFMNNHLTRQQILRKKNWNFLTKKR